MSREWKPGDVAIRTGADGSTVTSLVVRADRRRIDCWDNHGEADHWHHSNGGWNTIPDDPAFGTYRPLVVIDPEDREQVERLRDIYDREVITQNGDPDPRDVTPGARGNALQAALREFANPKPPNCGASISLDYGEQGSHHACEEPEGHDGPHAGTGLMWTAVQ